MDLTGRQGRGAGRGCEGVAGPGRRIRGGSGVRPGCARGASGAADPPGGQPLTSAMMFVITQTAQSSGTIATYASGRACTGCPSSSCGRPGAGSDGSSLANLAAAIRFQNRVKGV